MSRLAPRVLGSRSAALSERHRKILSRVLFEHGMGKTAILLRSSTNTLQAVVGGGQLLGATVDRLELALEHWEHQEEKKRIQREALVDVAASFVGGSAE